MNVIVVQERGEAPIPDELVTSLHKSRSLRELMAAGILELQFRPGGLSLRAGAYIGSAVLDGSAELRITEKSPGAAQELYRLAYPGAFRFVQTEARYASKERGFSSTWFRDVLWRVFLQTANAYISVGIEAKYKPFVQRSSQPRGRVLLKETIQHSFARGKPSTVYFRAHQLSRDTPVNQLILLALEHIARNAPRDATEIRSAATLAMHHFAGVRMSKAAPSDILDTIREDSARTPPPQAVMECVDLAAPILASNKVISGINDAFGLPIATFINLERLFERAVLEATRMTLDATAGWHVGRPEGSQFLFVDAKGVTANPDVVVTLNSVPVLLIDAKYRDLGSAISHDSVYQLLAHCESYGVSDGWLVGVHSSDEVADTWLGTTRSGVRLRVLAAPVSKLQRLLSDALKEFRSRVLTRSLPLAA